MGSELSACCSGSGDRDSQVEVSALSQQTDDFTPEEPNTVVSHDDINEFYKRLSEGVPVNLIQQNQEKLSCTIRMDTDGEDGTVFFLSCNNKERGIPVKDIKGVLHTVEELKRIDSSAGIKDTDTCAALHLATSGSCIPLFFGTTKDKVCFVEIVLQSKAV